MQIFFAHSSDSKPLVREISRYLPAHVKTWIDDERLAFGQNVQYSIRQVIQEEADYVVVFIDRDFASSVWVQEELRWALENEEQLGRVFVLPIVLHEDAWDNLGKHPLVARRFILCDDRSAEGIRLFSQSLVAELFGLLSGDLHKSRANLENETLGLLSNADQVEAELAAQIREVIFRYRKSNPILVRDLNSLLLQQHSFSSFTDIEFREFFNRLFAAGLLPGVVHDGLRAYVDEEHFSWKTSYQTDAKRAIASHAASMIRNNSIVALDSGSTSLELAREIAQGMRVRRWDNLSLVTNSIPAAAELTVVFNELGLTERDRRLELHIVGGLVRPETLAIVRTDIHGDECGFAETIQHLGGADIGFIGANGITESGLTTHTNAETRNKQDILRNSMKPVVLADSSKFGIVEETTFTTFDDCITLITDENPLNPNVERVRSVIEDQYACSNIIAVSL